jgi:hypothetical protein
MKHSCDDLVLIKEKGRTLFYWAHSAPDLTHEVTERYVMGPWEYGRYKKDGTISYSAAFCINLLHSPPQVG